MFLIDMMRKFELCFDLNPDQPNQQFLIPDLLPKEQSYTGDWDESLAFQYHYDVLPPSIISRFIVRMNHRIHESTYWRSGVVLAYQENLALVKSDREDKKIFIWIKGPEATRRNFLNIIRDDFDAIHRTIAKIKAEEKVALPEDPNIILDYQDLLNLEKMGKTTVTVAKLQKDFDLKRLLDGIESEEMRRRRQRPKESLRNQPSVVVNITTPNPPPANHEPPKSWINYQTIWTAAGVIVAIFGLAFWQPLWEKFNPKPTPSLSPKQSPPSQSGLKD